MLRIFWLLLDFEKYWLHLFVFFLTNIICYYWSCWLHNEELLASTVENFHGHLLCGYYVALAIITMQCDFLPTHKMSLRIDSVWQSIGWLSLLFHLLTYKATKYNCDIYQMVLCDGVNSIDCGFIRSTSSLGRIIWASNYAN